VVGEDEDKVGPRASQRLALKIVDLISEEVGTSPGGTVTAIVAMEQALAGIGVTFMECSSCSPSNFCLNVANHVLEFMRSMVEAEDDENLEDAPEESPERKHVKKLLH
jgi:hypothetical protein